MEIQIKSDDKFQITGAQVIEILTILGKLQASQTGKLFITLQESFTKQAQDRLVVEEKR